jgi:hypothetical protein
MFILLLALNQSRQQYQYKGNGDGPADAGRDLREWHELHPVRRREYGNVAGAALPAMAGINNGRVCTENLNPNVTVMKPTEERV